MKSQGRVMVATVFDLLAANYGIDRGLPGESPAAATTPTAPSPRMARKDHRCAARADHHRGPPVCRQRPQDAGKSMVIIGAAMNHWYHCDMNYRGIINMLMLCGCIGQSGGGWAHYVGQESCARKPAGRRWRLRWTGSARRAR